MEVQGVQDVVEVLKDEEIEEEGDGEIEIKENGVLILEIKDVYS